MQMQTRPRGENYWEDLLCCLQGDAISITSTMKHCSAVVTYLIPVSNCITVPFAAIVHISDCPHSNARHGEHLEIKRLISDGQ